MISLVVSGGGESSLKYAIDDTSTMTTTPSATHRRLRLRTRTRGREAPESTCSALGPPPPSGSFSNPRKLARIGIGGPQNLQRVSRQHDHPADAPRLMGEAEQPLHARTT